jgi:uncharacterized protein (DUF486 family)
MSWLSPALAPIVLSSLSNVFMTVAWYGHLTFAERPLWLAVLASWGIAFFEYCLAVPANRIGHQVYGAAELKTMQEVITLAVFAVFSVLYLGERIGASVSGRAISWASPSSARAPSSSSGSRSADA